MPGRKFVSGEGYRFGFNGQEEDPDMGVVFKYRIHDARVGRFLSVDPLAPDYPWNSCYAFAENRVIDGIELEGLERIHYAATGEFIKGNPVLKNFNVGDKCNPYNPCSPRSNIENYVTESRLGMEVKMPLKKEFIVHYGFYQFYFEKFADIYKFDWSSVDPYRAQDGYYPEPYYNTLNRRETFLNNLSYLSGVAVGVFSSINGPKVLNCMSKAKPSVKGTQTTSRLSFAEFEALKMESGAGYITVYHKGKLANGRVSSNKNLSTGLNKKDVSALDRAGDVHEFKIPKDVYDKWMESGKIKDLKDFDFETGVYNQELRFDKSISDQLNGYKVK